MNSAHDTIQRKTSYDGDGQEGLYNSKLVSERSRTLKAAIQHYKPIRVMNIHGACSLSKSVLYI